MILQRIFLIAAVILGGLLWAGVVIGLLFHREIAAIRRARKYGGNIDEFVCRRCGRCCRLNIITDAVTVDQMATATGRLATDLAVKLPLCRRFVLRKGDAGACVLLKPDAAGAPDRFECAAYAERPAACRRFPVLKLPFGIKGLDGRCPYVGPARDNQPAASPLSP